MPNMALREMSDLRPHLVLESHCAKRVGEIERGKARVLCIKIKKFVWGLLFGARSCKEKERRKLRLQVHSDLTYVTKPYKVVFDV